MFTSKDDPYHDNKNVHMAEIFNEAGGASALCFRRPRSINMEIAAWTISANAVTCKKCLRLLRQQARTTTTAEA